MRESFRLTSDDLTVAESLAEIFGFSPEGPQWTPDPAIVAYEGLKPSQAGWWWETRLVPCITAEEAVAFAAAIRKGAEWLRTGPSDFPEWFDKGDRYWDWKELMRLYRTGGLADRLEAMAAYMDGGAFRVAIVNRPYNTQLAFVDCNHPGFPPIPPPHLDTTNPPKGMSSDLRGNPDDQARLPGLEEHRGPNES